MQSRDSKHSTTQISLNLGITPLPDSYPIEYKTQINDWFCHFEAKEVIDVLQSEYNKNKIDDAKLRALFVSHTKKILEYYKNQNEPTGQIDNYIIAMEKLNKILDKAKLSFFGYAKFLPIAISYLYSKFRQKPYRFSGELAELIEFAKKDAVKKDGKKRLFNITCLAEHAFALLVVRYANFFLLSGKFKGNFDNSVVNMGLQIPPLIPVVMKNLFKLIGKIEQFEKINLQKKSENDFYTMLRQTEKDLEDTDELKKTKSFSVV